MSSNAALEPPISEGPRSSPNAKSRVQTWLQLFRAPNLFTVPGDPLIGYLVSNSGFVDHTILLTAAASICFYAAGLLMNDIVDLQEDLADRPTRPLPAGSAAVSSVRNALWLLNVCGLLFLAATGSRAALVTGACTVAAVCSYNFFTKKIEFNFDSNSKNIDSLIYGKTKKRFVFSFFFYPFWPVNPRKVR